MSKSLWVDAFCRISPWLEPSVQSLMQSPIEELSLESNLLSISIPRDQRKYMVHQTEPLYLARLNTTGRSSLRHGTHTVGFRIVFQGLLL